MFSCIFIKFIFQDRKVFTILGPYHSLRQSLRRRGWVEKFENMPFQGIDVNSLLKTVNKKKPPTIDDDDDGMRRKTPQPPKTHKEHGMFTFFTWL